MNKEISGLRIEDLERDEALKNSIRPLAIFNTGLSLENRSNIIAIAEGIKVPLYLIAYSIDYT